MKKQQQELMDLGLNFNSSTELDEHEVFLQVAYFWFFQK